MLKADITKEFLENEDNQISMLHAAFELGNCCRGPRKRQNVQLVLGLFLFSQIMYFNYPPGITYKNIMEGTLDVSDEIMSMIREYIDEEMFNNMKNSITRWDRAPEIYAGAALTRGDDFEGHASIIEPTPNAISELGKVLLEIENGDNVAEIGCGSGNFMRTVCLSNPKINYTGYEINQKAKEIATIRAAILGTNINLMLRDAFDITNETNDNRQEYDKVFANYPFGVRHFSDRCRNYYELLSEMNSDFRKVRSADWLFNTLICNMITERGKAVAIMPTGGTINRPEQDIRRHFVESGLIECIVALPSKIFSWTFIDTVMILFSKGNKNIRMIDASNLFTKKHSRNEMTDDDISAVVHMTEEDGEHSKIISIETIRNANYNLNPAKYFAQEMALENATTLGSVGNIKRGARFTQDELNALKSNSGEGFPYITYADIKDGVISETEMVLRDIPANKRRHIISQKALLITRNGNNCKNAIVDGSKRKVIPGENLYYVEFDETKANPYYIKAFLESDLGQTIIESILAGSHTRLVRVDDLQALPISLPPIEEQNEIAKRYKAAEDELRILRNKMDRAVDNLHNVISLIKEENNA